MFRAKITCLSCSNKNISQTHCNLIVVIQILFVTETTWADDFLIILISIQHLNADHDIFNNKSCWCLSYIKYFATSPQITARLFFQKCRDFTQTD